MEKGGESKSSTHANATLNSKKNANTGGNNGSDESGNANRRRQNKGTNKSHPSHRQRFFHSNFRNQGNSRNHHGVVSESPPSNSVGFFFGSTPPENFRWLFCCVDKRLILFLVKWFKQLGVLCLVHGHPYAPSSCVPSKLSASPHGAFAGSSPPVGSMPKPFPPFQHPSHQLLEDNEFRQQK